MKHLTYSLAFIFLLGCTKHYSADSFDLVSIEKEAMELISNDWVSMQHLPKTIKSLKPVSIRISDAGLYIKMDEMFVSESGLFIFRSENSMLTLVGGDPEFKHLANKVYSYVIKG